MTDWEGRAKLLTMENDELRAKVRLLEEALGMAAEPPLVFGLTKAEAIMFGVLMKNLAPRKETFMTALFSDRPDDAPQMKIIDVWICKMRKKLKPYGIEIDTCWGVGYQMPTASKDKVRELVG